IAGERLFGIADALEIARRQVQDAPRPLVLAAPHVPIALAQVVHRALAKDPAQRFASAEEMLAAVEAAVAHTPAAPTLIGYPVAPVVAVETREPSTMVHIKVLERRSRLRRAWAWLRFGRWRWRHEPA
ncbi:MAG TPA: hypothetical protein VL172_18610, partial [Kofleriaceae bacterium]|nr:hypothetical protein [Kofleriaceae bacterium]